jgi:hypothetical protein
MLIFSLSFLMAYSMNAQREYSAGGMSWKYEMEGGYLVMELRAPTKGWVGVGFNEKNDIVHSDLLLFHVRGSEAEGVDLYVKGYGNPKTDESMGGSHDIEIVDFRETEQETFIKFRRRWKVTDDYDYQLKNGEAFWLILAYYTQDEFDHHSIMRKHQKVVFE